MQNIQSRPSGCDSFSRCCRRGVSLVELIISGMLLSSLMLITVPTLKLIDRQGRSTDERQEALAEVANIMEQTVASPFDQLAMERVQQPSVSAHLERQLRDPRLRLRTSVDPQLEGTVRIEVELDWIGKAGLRERPVRLMAWVYDRRPLK